MRRRVLVSVGCALIAATVPAAPAYAHGVQGRADTPVPISVFIYAAGAVIVVSFAALALGWSKPRWSALPWRPAPSPLQVVLSAPVVWTGRILVLAATVFVLAAAAASGVSPAT